MTQEDKELLIKELCTRLPYHVFVQVSDKIFYGTELAPYQQPLTYGLIEKLRDLTIKPYLRPMSSMSEEEKKELENYLAAEAISSNEGLFEVLKAQRHTTNFLYSRHFDVLCLIEKGLALEAPEGMYNR